MSKTKEIIIDGIKYVPESNVIKADKFNGLEYVLVRTYSAGVHVGYLESENGREVTLRKSRRIWYWDGANSLSQLATEGTKKPANCKFTVEVDTIRLKEAIEIIPCTKEAQESINSVNPWKK
jgi:hypothetical protein